MRIIGPWYYPVDTQYQKIKSTTQWIPQIEKYFRWKKAIVARNETFVDLDLIDIDVYIHMYVYRKTFTVKSTAVSSVLKIDTEKRGRGWKSKLIERRPIPQNECLLFHGINGRSLEKS